MKKPYNKPMLTKAGSLADHTAAPAPAVSTESKAT